MPRKPSTTTGFPNTNPPNTLILVHKTTESNVFGSSPPQQQHSIQTLGSSASPQQKIVQVLVNRLKQKLPCNSGVSLDRVEADMATQQAIEMLVELSIDSLDIIAWALSELLDRLSKKIDPHTGHITIEVLQSQLFILKLLCLTMGSRWTRHSSSSDSFADTVDDRSTSPNSGAGSSMTYLWEEPPPLDDSCIKYILSVMVLFMRQTANSDVPLMVDIRSTDTSFRDFDDRVKIQVPARSVPPPSLPHTHASDPSLRNRSSASSFLSGKISVKSISHSHIAAVSTEYERTHMSLVNSSPAVNDLIARYVGRIIFHISASNWKIVFERLSTKINFIATHPELNPDSIDLQLMAHAVLDRTRLVTLLNQFSSLLVNMRTESQRAIAVHLRSAIWNWINVFPSEFNDTVRVKGKTEGAPERVFDLLYSAVQAGSEKIFWPTLTILNCISPDRVSADVQYGNSAHTHKGRKELRFSENTLKHLSSHSKFSEVALACAVDMCRAAAYINPEGDVPLRLVAPDIADEIKSALYSWGSARKPFWESQDDIDIALYADALVAVYRFLPVEDSGPLFTTCLEPERAEPVKTCVIRACLTLIQDAARFHWQRPLDQPAIWIASRGREILASASLRRLEIDRLGVTRRVAPRPRAKRILPEPLSEKEVLILGILSVWRLSPLFFQPGIQGLEDMENWVAIAVKLWEAPTDISVKIMMVSCMQRMYTFLTPPIIPNHMILVNIIKMTLPCTLLSIVGNLLTTRTDIDAQNLWMSVAHQILDVYVSKTDIEHVKSVQVDPGRTSAFVLAEIAFLVSLASADNTISQLAAKGLRMICRAELQPDAPPNPTITDEDRAQRNPIYEQLGDPRVAVVGRVGHQKRIRKLIRMLSLSAGIHVVVWEECYWRWRTLNESINNMGSQGSTSADSADSGPNHLLTQQDARFQWHNLTLFLAALGGSCIQTKQDLTILAKVIPPKFLLDKLRAIQSPLPLVDDFVTSLINLLVAGDMYIRDVVREALGSELSPRLYGKLIKNLESTVTLLDDESESRQIDSCAVLLDQVIGILKLITENTEVALEDAMNVDMSPSMQMLATFLARFSGPASYRIKIKYCILCESVCSRTDTLTIRKDSPARYIILDILLLWMSPRISETPGPNTLLNDLNMACLRAVVKLLDRLQLRSHDTSNTGDDAIHYVSRLFNKYSTALLTSLETCQSETHDQGSELGSIEKDIRFSQKESELNELVITGLAHLVAANSESGFKQCLPLAYDSDIRKRTIFAHVFARVIGQGTVFDPEDKSLTKARHASLCELVRGSDLVLAITICEVCPPSEVELMISVLLNVFDSRASLLNLIKLMIEREVAQTNNEVSLFRSNSTCTRFLSAFARLHGYNYLRNLVQPLLDTMVAMPPGTGYEVDPSKAVGQDIIQNQKNVEYVASTFLQLISSSLPALPGMFREICAHIAKVVTEVWPDSKYAAMGAFIFLRFISPAVVSPDTIDIEIPKENYMVLRRGLMVIAKIIQNLANNIFFGKEAHMTILNKFLENNIANITRFLSEMHKFSATNEDNNDHWLGITSDDTDAIVLHRFFHKHADKIGKELLSLSKPPLEGDPTSISVSGKRAWDGLCALLVDLGSPMEVPRLSNLKSDEHREYSELMSRQANRDTTSVEKLFVETDVCDNNAVFVLLFSSIDVENLDIELFMYHIFKSLQSDMYRSRDFDIILDCTSFTSKSEVPLQWLKYCAEVIPSDIRVRFSTTRILNANSLTQKYLRRLYNISAGTPLCNEIKAYTSVLQLLEDVETAALPSLAFAVSLEQDVQDNFTDVTMKTSMREPVVLKVGSSHIRVTSVKSLPISPGLLCKSTDLIPLADVSDVYNVSTGQELHEFIIRRRQGVTVYFSSPSREVIVKTIRSAKGRLKEVQAFLTEQFSRFSNVPATLLHIGLLSVDLSDEKLRGAAYDLLGAVCNYLKYDKSPIVACKAGFISGDPIAFVLNLSEKLAEFAPRLTLDFIHEVSAAMTSMDKASISTRISCLQYMSPWIRNLSHFANATHPLYERSGARLRDCIRTLSDLSVAYPEIMSTIQKHIWAEVAKLDSYIVDIVLDELVRTATDGGIGTRRCETISHIVAALSSINVRGRIYLKLRKSLSKVSPIPPNTLPEHQNWNEISTLIRLALVVGSQSTHSGQSYLYVPEIIHLVTSVAGEGDSLVRKSVYGIIMNLLQSLYLSRPDDRTEPELMRLINDCTLPENLRLFGLRREAPSAEYSNTELSSEKATLDTQEKLTQLLLRIMTVSAGSTGLLNVWRARWMGLVTATAFQQSPAIQTRSFVALATLAVAQVDDDFLYQILVAFKSALARANESNTAAITSMLRCMCKVVPAVVGTSRYICVLFWLAVALLQGSHASYYAEASSLLQVTLRNMEDQGLFKNNSVQNVLLEAREPLEEVTSQLDDMLRLSFETSFSFSLAAIIFKGLRHSSLKESAEAALRTLLQVTVAAHDANLPDLASHDALGYIIALLTVSTTPNAFHRLLKESELDSDVGIPDGADDDGRTPCLTAELLGIHDSTTALLVTSFVGSILYSAQGDDAETEILYGLLSSLCFSYPDIVSMTYESMQDRVKDIFANSSNPSIMRSVSNIFRVALQDTTRFSSSSSTALGSTSTLSTVEEDPTSSRTHLNALEVLGMQGLGDSFQFLLPNRGHATKLLQWIPTLVTLMIS